MALIKYFSLWSSHAKFFIIWSYINGSTLIFEILHRTRPRKYKLSNLVNRCMKIFFTWADGSVQTILVWYALKLYQEFIIYRGTLYILLWTLSEGTFSALYILLALYLPYVQGLFTMTNNDTLPLVPVAAYNSQDITYAWALQYLWSV